MQSTTDVMTPFPILQTAFTNGSIGSWVDGEWFTGSGRDMLIDDPSTGEEILRYRDGGTEAADAAIGAAIRQAQSGAWSKMTPADRGTILWKVSQHIAEHAEDLARLESTMVGRPITDTRRDVAAVVSMFSHYAGWSDKVYGDVIPLPSNHLNYTVREPYGVVLQLTPWNAPLFTGGWQLAPALCVGNCVVLKPSEFTPLTSLALVQLAEEAGLPRGTVQVLLGAGDTAGVEATSDPRVGKIVFLGSVPTGRLVAAAAGKNLVPTLLELGGKSPNLVLPGVDPASVIDSAVSGVMQAAGQSCTALSRILVPESGAREIAGQIADGVDRLRVGAALDDTTDVGPLCYREHLDRVVKTVGDGLSNEAEVLTGGTPGDGPGYFFEPTVIFDEDASSSLAKTEIFGPVVVVSAYKDLDDAIEVANSTDFGLAAMVWSNDVGEAHRVASQIQSGTVWINGGKALNVMSPFGGYKSSGYGRSSGPDVLLEYTRTKSVWVNLS